MIWSTDRKFLAQYGDNCFTQQVELLQHHLQRQTGVIDEEQLPLVVAGVFAEAQRPIDHLLRGTDRQRGLGALDDVVSLMANEHNWSPEQQQLMSDTFRSVVLQQLAVEQEQVMGSISIPPKKG